MDMAYHTYVDISTSDAQKFFKALTPDSQFLYSKVKRKTGLFSSLKKLRLSERSLLPQISLLWSALTPTEQLAWKTAGSYAGMTTGWRAFVQEQCARIVRGLSVPNSPSNYHLGLVGRLHIGGSATQIHIAQYHPMHYYVHHRVTGKKGLYAPVLVTEPITLPIQIGFSYKSDLTSLGGSPYALFYIEIYSSYQGVDRVNVLEIPLTPSIGWNTVLESISGVLGYVKGYAVFIHIFGYSGDFYFDHVKILHGGTNWARDKECSRIQQTFTNQYYQIPAHWVALELPSGSWYASDYVDF